MKTRTVVGLLAFWCSCVYAKEPSQLKLTDVFAIPGSYVADQSGTAPDGKYVYMGSAQGDLTVINKDARDPVVKTIHVADTIYAVSFSKKYVIVTAPDGIHLFEKQHFTEVAKIPIASNASGSLVVTEESYFISTGESEMRYEDGLIYLSKLNEDEVVIEIDVCTWAIKRVYGETLEVNVTGIVNLQNTVLETAPSPADLLERTNQFVNLELGDDLIIQTVPGPYGRGVNLLDKVTLAVKGFVPSPFANVAVRQGNRLYVGRELGIIELWNIESLQSPVLLDTIDLRDRTGRYGPEEIEIRGFGISKKALTAWSSGKSGNEDLPTLFVFQLK